MGFTTFRALYEYQYWESIFQMRHRRWMMKCCTHLHAIQAPRDLVDIAPEKVHGAKIDTGLDVTSCLSLVATPARGLAEA